MHYAHTSLQSTLSSLENRRTEMLNLNAGDSTPRFVNCDRMQDGLRKGCNDSRRGFAVVAERLFSDMRDAAKLAFGLPMKPTVEYHDSLERMKLYAGSQSRDEPYCQDHGGDNPSSAAFDFGHLEFAAGDARAIEQVPHPCQP
jgi:hypothetical protein